MTPDEAAAHERAEAERKAAYEAQMEQARERVRLAQEAAAEERAQREAADARVKAQLAEAMDADEFARLMAVHEARDYPALAAAKTYFAQAKLHPDRFTVEMSKCGNEIVRSNENPSKCVLVEDAMRWNYCA